MIDKKIFFHEYRKHLDIDGKLTQKEVNAIDIFLDMVNERINKISINEWAYIFATTFHETAFTFEPVEEAFKFSDNWRRKNLRYYPYHGRGYVQLTWKNNYQKFGRLLGIDLVKKPELAFNTKYAFEILFIGCKDGLFTGVAMQKFIVDGVPDFVKMRRVVNGNDKAEVIADYAIEFKRILKLSIKN